MTPIKKLIEILEKATDLLSKALDGQVKGKIKCPHFMKVCDAQQLLQETKMELEAPSDKTNLELHIDLEKWRAGEY